MPTPCWAFLKMHIVSSQKGRDDGAMEEEEKKEEEEEEEEKTEKEFNLAFQVKMQVSLPVGLNWHFTKDFLMSFKTLGRFLTGPWLCSYVS